MELSMMNTYEVLSEIAKSFKDLKKIDDILVDLSKTIENINEK